MTNHFVCQLRKRIRSQPVGIHENDVHLEYVIALPFAPFPGLEVCDGYFSDRITEVCWVAKEQRFHCETQDSYLIPNRAKLQDRMAVPTIEQVVAEYLEFGWHKR